MASKVDRMTALRQRHESLITHGVDLETRTVFLSGGIEPPLVENVVSSLFLMQEISKEPITMYVNSMGGTDDMMFYLYDAMMASEAAIHTVGRGMVCSAASLILVAGDTRSATQNTWCMTHKWRFSIEGDEDEMQAASAIGREVSDRYWKLIARHTKHTAAWWFEKSKGHGEFWMDAAEMLKQGVIDRILPPNGRNYADISSRKVRTSA